MFYRTSHKSYSWSTVQVRWGVKKKRGPVTKKKNSRPQRPARAPVRKSRRQRKQASSQKTRAKKARVLLSTDQDVDHDIVSISDSPENTVESPPTRRSTWAPKRAVTKSSRRSTTERRAPSHTPARKSSRRSTPDRPAAKSKRRPTPERPAPSSTPAQPAQTSAVAPASKPSQRSTPERPARISSERSSPVLPVARKSSERSPADKHRRKTVISPQIVHDPPSPGPQTPLPSSAQRSRRQPTPRAEPPARSPRFQIAPGHQVNDQMTRIEEISAQLRVTPFKPFCACLT